MIDFHTHILPGIDDGSRDSNMTAAMLWEERKQNVELIVATPHFYADRMRIDTFLRYRELALEKVKKIQVASTEPLPKIICGAEVYYFYGIGEADEVKRLCIDGTQTILLEMPFTQWMEDVLRDVEGLIEKQKLNVVLAHVERYYGFQRDRRIWDRIMELPLTPQINAGSFIPKRGLLHPGKKRKFCMRFLEKHPDLILGSDCHNTTSRAPNLAKGRKEISVEALAKIDRATRLALEM